VERVPVESSNIESVGYDRATATLEIEFKNGGTYQYFDVPETEHAALLGSGSLGSYFATAIRGHFRFAKV
jgi:hypothetical protein